MGVGVSVGVFVLVWVWKARREAVSWRCTFGGRDDSDDRDRSIGKALLSSSVA